VRKLATYPPAHLPTCPPTHLPLQHFSLFNRDVVNPIKKFGYVGAGRKAFTCLKKDVLEVCLLRRTKACLTLTLTLTRTRTRTLTLTLSLTRTLTLTLTLTLSLALTLTLTLTLLTKAGRADEMVLPPKLITIEANFLDAKESDFYQALCTQSNPHPNPHP
jgi:hypothetical protein